MTIFLWSVLLKLLIMRMTSRCSKFYCKVLNILICLVFFYNNIDSFWRPFSWKFLGKWHAREREKQIASPSRHFSFSLLQTAQLNHGSLEEENRSAASIFLWEQCLCLFQRWFTVFPIHIINTTIQKLKLCFILKIGQYLYR